MSWGHPDRVFCLDSSVTCMQDEQMSRQYVFAALIAAIGRCLAWKNGSQAVRVVRAAKEAGLSGIIPLAMSDAASQM